MDLKSTQLKDTYGNLLTIGTTAGSPTTGTLENGDGEDITALDVAGTITSDGLTSDGNISLSGNGTGNRNLFLGSETASYAGTFRLQAGGGSAGFGGGLTMYGHSHASKPGDVAVGISSGSGGSFRVNGNGIDTGTDLFEVKSTGDISFRDGSANEAFYWDASEARLGIGTDSPDAPLTVISNAHIYSEVTDSYLRLSVGNTLASPTQSFVLRIDNSDSDKFQIRDTTNSESRLTIDTSGNVGIGTDSPSEKLAVQSAFTTSASDVFLEINSGHQASGGGDVTGEAGILFKQGGSGDVLRSAGAIISGREGNYSANSVADSYLAFETAVNGTNTEAMRIDSSGNVKINNGVLELGSEGVSSGYINSEEGLYFNVDSNNTPEGSVFVWATGRDGQSGGTERMRIDGSGRLLVGTETALSGFSGTAQRASFSATGDIMTVEVGTGTTAYTGIHVLRQNSNGKVLSFERNSTDVGSISVTTTATAYNTSSDYRLKENIVELDGALNKVLQLKPSKFNFKSDTDSTVSGFIAHEVQEVVPEAVTGEKDEMVEYEVTPAVLDDEGNVIEEAVMGTKPVYQGIDQSKLVPILVGAIQELKAEIEQLKAK